MLPPKHSEIEPRSSDTTTTTASVSSVMPMAARWRVPSALSSRAFADSGKHRARLRDAQVLDDHGAVVELVLAVGQEQRHQQLLATPWRPSPRRLVEVVDELGVALEHDERAHARRRQPLGRLDDLLEDVGLLVRPRVDEQVLSRRA